MPYREDHIGMPGYKETTSMQIATAVRGKKFEIALALLNTTTRKCRCKRGQHHLKNDRRRNGLLKEHWTHNVPFRSLWSRLD